MTATDDTERLSSLRATGLLDTPQEEAFDRITRLVSKIIGAPVALVSLVDSERQFFKSQVGLPAPYDTTRETPLSHSFCQHVVATDQALVVSDARVDPRVRDNLAVRDLSVVAYIGVPLRLPNGSVIGSLCAVDTLPRDWDRADVAALNDLAALVMDQIALRTEIGQRREAERQQKLLISELHHRVKNTLAVVQSIIFLSLKTATTLTQFRDSIRARIMSLANTHTLLVDQQWVSTSLMDLFTTELALHEQEGRINLDGPDVLLPSDVAVALGMCIHELMTNASKYGALSTPAGNVQISWKIEEFDGGTELQISWIESGGPTVTSPERKGFGSLLLDRLIKQQTSGDVELDFQPNGLRAKLMLRVPSIRQATAQAAMTALLE